MSDIEKIQLFEQKKIAIGELQHLPRIRQLQLPN